MRHRSGSDYVGLGRSTMRLRATTRTFSSAGPAGNGHSKTAISRCTPSPPSPPPCCPLFYPPLRGSRLLPGGLFQTLHFSRSQRSSSSAAPSFSLSTPASLMDFENYSRALRLADARRFSDLKCEFSDFYAVFFLSFARG